MRAAIFVGWVLLLGLTLVYGGLMAAEKGMHDLMAWHRPLGAMSLQPAGKGSLKITFAGKTWTINLKHLGEIFKEWWPASFPPAAPLKDTFLRQRQGKS